jgi:NhaA family Na+:H+ antiporter
MPSGRSWSFFGNRLGLSDLSLDRETRGGLLLIFTTLLALLVANSSLADHYHEILHQKFIVGFPEFFALELDVKHWINDGLMAIFFLVAGLEIKREVTVGELSTSQKAITPIIAAAGGLVVPALIFLVFNHDTAFRNGWGVPIATDIAYSLGILALMGKRIPVQLKIFLTALAIADDLGAIVVIAFFYSTEIAWSQIGMAGIIFVLLIFMKSRGVKSLAAFSVVGFFFWACFIHSGIHPTIAGVLLSLTIPIEPQLDSLEFRRKAERRIQELARANLKQESPLTEPRQLETLKAVRLEAKAAHPPILRLENGLTGFNAFVVIPLFALANAGVKLDVPLSEVLESHLGLGVVLGLVIGKVVGIGLFTFVGERFGLLRLPPDISWLHVIGLGFIAGIGFTMSLFITNLAFVDPEVVKIAKISILLASLVAAIAGVLVLLWTRRSVEESRE